MSNSKGSPHTIRIIAGTWRSRKLKVLTKTGLRPTPERLRETLFNWLNLEIINSRCLDLFAGSGALGFEAASRGAQQVWLVERDNAIIHCLNQQVNQFAASQIKVIRADALQLLKKKPDSVFDIVFLDPPFNTALLEPCCRLLEQGEWLNTQAWIYLEQATGQTIPHLPSTWHIVRQQKAGLVACYLAYRQA